MFIDQDTKLRVNIYYEYKGFSRLDTPEIRAMANVVEIPEPNPPEDYSDDTYFKTEQNEAPYVIYTKRPQEQIDQAENARLIQRMDALEARAARMVREAILSICEDPKLRDLDNKIDALRKKLKKTEQVPL